jgi:hypothetical protein
MSGLIHHTLIAEREKKDGVKSMVVENATTLNLTILDPKRFHTTIRNDPNNNNNNNNNRPIVGLWTPKDAGSDADGTASDLESTPKMHTNNQVKIFPTPQKSSMVNGGGGGGDADSTVEKVRANIARLNLFVAKLPDRLAELQSQINMLEKRKQTEIKTREDLPLLHRITAVQNYLKATCSMIQHRVEEKILDDRMRQMNEYFQRIPVTEKNERSLLDSWNAMFDVHAIVPRTLAKDYCDYCKKPLLLIRKQAQLQCTFCARMTEHLMPISHTNAWLKTSMNAQPENKRIKSVQMKLNQFRAGTPAIPSQITLAVRHALRSRTHLAPESMVTSTQVSNALTVLGHDKYIPYSAKIAAIVNGHEVCELTDEQINEIISRLKLAQFTFGVLVNSGRLSSRHFYTNHIVNQIAAYKGWPALTASFPVQKTKKLSREMGIVWKQLLFFLRQIDTQHTWP